MGWLRKRKMNSAAVGELPGIPMPPASTTIHNHGTGWVGIIAVGTACLLASMPVLWWFLVSLFANLGARQPEQEAAFWVISIPFAVIVGWFLRWLVVSILESYFSYRRDIEQEYTRREEARLLAAQTTIDPGRMNEADFDFARTVLACMMVAYGWMEKNGRTEFNGRWRPWSMRSALDTAAAIGVKLTQDRANSISTWLYDREVITSPDGGQITKKFPNLSSVRAMIDNEFGKPINVVLSPDLRSNVGYEHI